MTSSILPNVQALSDDEASPVPSDRAPTQPIAGVARRQPAKRKQKAIVTVKHVDGRALRHKVDGPCGCLCQCFVPFRTVHTFDQLHKVRKDLIGLDKVEQDTYA